MEHIFIAVSNGTQTQILCKAQNIFLWKKGCTCLLLRCWLASRWFPLPGDVLLLGSESGGRSWGPPWTWTRRGGTWDGRPRTPLAALRCWRAGTLPAAMPLAQSPSLGPRMPPPWASWRPPWWTPLLGSDRGRGPARGDQRGSIKWSQKEVKIFHKR